MSKFDYTAFLGEGFGKDFFKGDFPFDVKSIWEIQRKNVEAFSEAQQLAMQGWQEIAQRQSALVSKLVEDNSDFAREMITEGTPEQKVAKHADLMKKTYEESVTSWRELAELVSQSNQQAANIVNKRISASLNEIKKALDAAPVKKAA